jgi:hypothetical protein
VLSLATTAWPADQKLRGRYYFGPDVEVFEPCTQVISYWVKGSDKVLQPLRNRSEQVREKRGKIRPIYVEVVGSIDTKSERAGPAENFDGFVHVKKVVKSSAAVPKKCSE